MSFTETFLAEVAQIADRIDSQSVERCVEILVNARAHAGRLLCWALAAARAMRRTR